MHVFADLSSWAGATRQESRRLSRHGEVAGLATKSTLLRYAVLMEETPKVQGEEQEEEEEWKGGGEEGKGRAKVPKEEGLFKANAMKKEDSNRSKKSDSRRRTRRGRWSTRRRRRKRSGGFVASSLMADDSRDRLQRKRAKNG